MHRADGTSAAGCRGTFRKGRDERVGGYAWAVMRLLGGLGLVAPVVLIAVFIGMPTAVDLWVDEGARSIVAAVAAGAIGVSLTAIVVFLYVRIRFWRIIRASERLAAGELGVTRSRPGEGPRPRGPIRTGL